MSTWRLINSIETHGAMQMAIDEAILTARIERRVPNTLRFFTWSPPCLTIGYFQSLEKEVKTEHARQVDIVRRYTGGGATLHDKEMTYSLAISEQEVPDDIVSSYRTICDAIVKGLHILGLSAEFREINDVIVNDQKISGNAQTRKNGVVLQHGTILLDADLREMFSLLNVPDEKTKDKMSQSAEERVTTLKEELGKEVSIRQLGEALKQGFSETFNIAFEESELTEYEAALARRLCEEKYSTRDWNHLR